MANSSPAVIDSPKVNASVTPSMPTSSIRATSPGTSAGTARSTIDGVTEYWLVDPVAETVSILRPHGGALIVTRTFGRNETLYSPLLVGFGTRPGRYLLAEPSARVRLHRVNPWYRIRG